MNSKIVPKVVAPEGGWGYCVMSGMSVCVILTIGILPCFGLLFGDFLHRLGEGTQTIALVTSTYFMASSIAGLFLRPLLQRFPMRNVGLVVAIIFAIGSFLTAYATTVGTLLISFGVLQGIGFGILSTISIATFNKYFVHRRILMMGIAQTVTCVGSMLLPLVIVQLQDELGFRGCLLILAAFNLHMVVAMLVMHQPIEYHGVGHRKVSVIDKRLVRKHIIQCEPIDDDALDIEMHHQTIGTKEVSEVLLSTSSANTLIQKSLRQRISDFMDLSLLNDFVYVNICVGMSFALYSDISFFTFQPLYLLHLGYSPTSVANIIALGAASDVVSRLLLGIISFYLKATARSIFFAGAVSTIAVRLVFPYVTEFAAMAAITCVLGFIRASLHVPISLIIADHLPAERFPSGQGLFMFLQGIIMFVLGPLVGRIHDVTGSFAMLFMCLNVAMAMCAIPWSIELGALRFRN